MPDQYAFGDWTVDGINCPISSAGLTNAEVAAELGEEFDEQVLSEGFKQSKGVIDDEVAEKAWSDMTERLEKLSNAENRRAEWYRQLHELAEEVQRKTFNKQEAEA